MKDIFFATIFDAACGKRRRRLYEPCTCTCTFTSLDFAIPTFLGITAFLKFPFPGKNSRVFKEIQYAFCSGVTFPVTAD
jgi:hypothetical protein